MNASVFTSYKYAMNLILLSSPEAEPTLAQITAAGSASGVFTSLRSRPPPFPSPSPFAVFLTSMPFYTTCDLSD